MPGEAAEHGGDERGAKRRAEVGVEGGDLARRVGFLDLLDAHGVAGYQTGAPLAAGGALWYQESHVRPGHLGRPCARRLARPGGRARRPRGGHAPPQRLRRRARSPRGARSRRRRAGARLTADGRAVSDLAFRPATELAALVRAKDVSPVFLVRAYLERIERWDGDLHAYVTVCRTRALAEAEQAERAVARGEPLGPLHGIPFAVKDQFDTAGEPTTLGSRLLAGRVPSEDAAVVARLRAAGGILLGKLNLTEFALGGTLIYPFGQPRNPWNREHEPGGSSSGSGIAAAAGLAAATLGEDTGGSIRSPASWCGVVGLRPTWGLVPRTGCFPVAWSMDTPGPITRTVEDAALLLTIIAGPDGRDRHVTRPAPDVLATLRTGVAGLRIGVIRELTHGSDTAPEVRGAVLEACRVLARSGAEVEEVSLPLVPLAGAVFMALADSEAAGFHHPWLRDRGKDYDAGTRRRLLTAALLPAVLYHRAARARTAIRAEVLGALERYDLLAGPAAPRAAPPIAQAQAPIASKEEAARRFFDRRSYTTPFSLAGAPAIALPCGATGGGLPIALQLAGRRFDEATLLRAAWAYEQATPWRARRPPLAA
ncbi:MAG: amidase [Candidatus Rokubacteria bacterium]|nr:amidase [Candidatus Rokubacteria bacterium]